MYLLFVLVLPFLALSQKIDTLNGDTLNIDTINAIRLKEVVLEKPNLPNFVDYDEMKKYFILKRKVFKVYPYSVLVSIRLSKLEQRLSRIKDKKSKRDYIKIVQRYIEHEFTDTIKKMTQTEGQILCKLIHRQTGRTTFDIITSLRSSWTAFWWNATSYFFNISLKKKYKPNDDKEDKMIENILQRAFFNRELERTDIHKKLEEERLDLKAN